MLTQRIEALLAEHLSGTNLFVVEIRELPKAKIQVFLDGDEGITIQQCARASRFLEHRLEEEKLVPEHYTLEVSSPGVGQPLLLHRQYVKNIGRTVEVTLADGSKQEGVLTAVAEEQFTLQQKVKNKETRKWEELTTTIPFSSIQTTKVQVTF